MEIVDNHSVARECIQFLMLFFAISKKPRAPLAEIKLHSRAFDVLFTLQASRWWTACWRTPLSS